jgi:hypothetical protein
LTQRVAVLLVWVTMTRPLSTNVAQRVPVPSRSMTTPSTSPSARSTGKPGSRVYVFAVAS